MIGLKVKAGALQFIMFVVVVIALILASFIILIHTNKQFKIQTDFVKETIINADKGIEFALQNNILKEDTVTIDFNKNEYKTLQVYSDSWGVFEKVISVSKIKHNKFKKIALVGAKQPKNNRTALYVKDNNKPLVVVGNTRIEGLSYLPKRGIRTGNISGHSYNGSTLVYGATKSSSTELPTLLNEIFKPIRIIHTVLETLNQNQFIDLKKNNTHQNSFYNPLQIVFSNRNIYLTNVSLTGHIIVQSKTKIIVDPSSKLKDVILIAPEIEVKNNTKGTFQAFATNQLSIGTNCNLEYPSALVLNEDVRNNKALSSTTNQKETPSIKIYKKTKLKGMIVYLGSIKNYKAQVYIDEKVQVMGEVYCTQNLELLGSVYGSVFTSNFVANQSGSSYQNHLYNAVISIDNLPKDYVGLPFKNAKKDISKWLY